jgi:hypothetical protein
VSADVQRVDESRGLADAPLWRVERRPHPPLLIATIVLGLALMAGSAGLLHLLMARPDWRIGWAVGLFLGGYLVLTVARGSFAEIGADGRLIFGWGRTANLRLDLRSVAAVRVVSSGLLAGVGLAVPIAQVEILHRKGLSRRKMRDMESGLGLAVVLEHLTPADASEIERLRQRFSPT